MSTAVVQRENEDLHIALAAMRAAAAGCSAFDSVEAKAERLLLAQELRTLADALAVSAAGEADVGDVAKAHGCLSAAAFVGQHSSVSPADVRADSKLARWLRGLPELASAFAEGRVTRRHLDRLRQLDNLRCRGQFRAQQAMLIEFAESLDWRNFLSAVRYWMLANDPDGTEPKDQVQASGVKVRREADGSVRGEFVLDPVRGAAFLQAFEAELERLRSADDANGVERSRYQRGADALLALVGRGYARPDGSVPAPLVNIVMSQLVAEQLLGRLNGTIAEHEPFDLDANDVDGRCELIDGTPLHPWFALMALSVGQFRRYVFDAPGRVIEASKSRAFPKHLKHLLLLEARGRCSTPGCDAPFSWLQADHVVPHSKRGPTAHANGQILCGPHNRHKRDRVPVGSSLAR